MVAVPSPSVQATGTTQPVATREPTAAPPTRIALPATVAAPSATRVITPARVAGARLPAGGAHAISRPHITPTVGLKPAGTPVTLPTFAPAPVVPPATGRKVVAIDPGHGGRESGAVSPGGLAEKNVNLRIALKLAALLRAAGYEPVLTRSSDTGVNLAGRDLNGDGVVNTNDDLQARVDVANAAHADILVNIHNNSSADSGVKGTRVYYCAARPFASQSIRLAGALERHIVETLQAAGYSALQLGISDDARLRKPYGHLALLGPLTPRVARASNMPGALGETLYLSNPVEGSLLARDSILSAIAQGYFDGIREYFGQ